MGHVVSWSVAWIMEAGAGTFLVFSFPWYSEYSKDLGQHFTLKDNFLVVKLPFIFKLSPLSWIRKSTMKGWGRSRGNKHDQHNSSNLMSTC